MDRVGPEGRGAIPPAPYIVADRIEGEAVAPRLTQMLWPEGCSVPAAKRVESPRSFDAARSQDQAAVFIREDGNMPNGIAIGWNPRDWRLGWCRALDDSGRQVGEWLMIGPLAICWDWD